jgi:hypothetical protein
MGRRIHGFAEKCACIIDSTEKLMRRTIWAEWNPRQPKTNAVNPIGCRSGPV